MREVEKKKAVSVRALSPDALPLMMAPRSDGLIFVAASPFGEVAERLNVPDSKSGVRVSVPGVRIPPSPP